MLSSEQSRKLGIIFAALLIGAGFLIVIRLITEIPTRQTNVEPRPTLQSLPAANATFEPPTVSNAPADPGPLPQFTIGVTDPLPSELLRALEETDYRSVRITNDKDGEQVDLILGYASGEADAGEPIYEQVFAVVDRFDTIATSLSWSQLQSAWQGQNRRHETVAILANDAPALIHLLGEPSKNSVHTMESVAEMAALLQEEESALGIVPFDQLVPELVVLDIDEQNPLQNDDEFHHEKYPLIAIVTMVEGANSEYADRISELLELLPVSNRKPEHMTTVAMTGVTAMVRFTAARMDQEGAEWPAEVVGASLANADITVISNEVPFVEGCQTNIDPDNVVFCSKPEYMQALKATGADIVGLTGNHQNDHGREGALQSLEFYADAGMSVYGGGTDKSAAMQPIVVEHNGNRIAFLGANSYGPPEAWATDSSPGSAPFDLNIMSAMIRRLKNDDEADVVLAELQYQESYNASPLPEQRQDFRALIRAGADVVTGVQSHVPQAVEFLEGRLILYGLGNFFFDQMWEEETRDGLIVLHTIYEGRHISTRLVPTRLYDYGQPRWASSVERARILERIFTASANE